MLTPKISTHQKSLIDTHDRSFKFSVEALKTNTALVGLQRKLGKSAKDLKSIIEKFWLD